MKIQINPKSTLFGLAAGILTSLTIAAAAKPAGETGRYQISAGQHGAFVVDTATGQV